MAYQALSTKVKELMKTSEDQMFISTAFTKAE